MDEMEKALKADGEKLRGLTGQDHGPWLIDECESARRDAPIATALGDEVRHLGAFAPTAAEIEAAMTPSGGWTRDQLAAWGVPWPPPKGWKRRLLSVQTP